MLTYDLLHREVAYRQSITNGTVAPPKVVSVYIREDNYRLKQITVSDFPNYRFVEYTYASSLFPVVSSKA